MVAKKIRGRLTLLLVAITLVTAAIFAFLMHFNKDITEQTASEFSSIYMSEMMYQTQDHFESIIRLKNKEAISVAHQAIKSELADKREVLIENAQIFGFEYLALYDNKENYETIMGESAWYRNLSAFLEDVKADKVVSTTGYLVKNGEKYLVFGVPVEFEMSDGSVSSVLLLGFNTEKLKDYIHVENLEQFGHDTRLDIILTNGSYVLKEGAIEYNSYFEHILQYGSFVGLETEEGIVQIERAMAEGEDFSYTVTMNGTTKHIYGAGTSNPGNWYFILSMPQSATDILLDKQNTIKLLGFGFAGVAIFLLFLGVFLIYFRMSYRQIKETEDARNEAEIANNAKSSFLSNMSHDIRTPMNAIAGFATIAEDSIRQGKDEEALNAISKMKRSTDYLRSLIGDVLDMSKIESGKLSLMPETISLNQAVEMVDTIAKVRTEMKSQKYHFKIYDVLHDSIICDQTRLTQILVNLIGNAVKFTENGGEIQFEVWQEKSQKGQNFVRTCFLVCDNGIGMSQEFLGYIFDSFSREENRVRKIEGTGLGLAISKKLIDMMGGDISVESEEGKGSRFLLRIDLPKAWEIKSSKEDLALTANMENIRTIMAEDNDFNYEIAEALLESHGFIVTRAENGKEAVRLYCSSPSNFDLILMDLRMPVMDGYQATEQIRRFETRQHSSYHIPIFALSADVFAEDIKKCTEVGMEGHISKPIDMNELLLKITKYYSLQ